MSQQVLLKASGLYSYPQSLTYVPPGALLRALNIFINRDGVIELRRGFKIYGDAMGSSSTNYSHQLLTYKGRLLRHYGAGAGTTLEYDNGSGTFSKFSLSLTGNTHTTTTIDNLSSTSQLEVGMFISGTGIPSNATIATIVNQTSITISVAATTTSSVSLTFTPNIQEALLGTRIKGVEANSNFYFTTSNGIKKISVTSASTLSTGIITAAGGIKALDLQATINPAEGFFSQNSTVAYRTLWGIKDANQNLIEGSPSERVVISNTLVSLLTTNFNSLLAQLDSCSNSGGINSGDYVSSLKVSASSNPSVIKTQLGSLNTKIDNDTVITEGAINTATIAVTANIATLVFNSTVASFLSVGDYIQVSGLVVGGGAGCNGYFRILTVSTTTVTFAIFHSDFIAVADTGGTVKRLKYTLAPYKVNEDTAITVAIIGAEIKTQKAYLRFGSDISGQFSVGDTIAIAGLSGNVVGINGNRVITGIQKKGSTSNDTVQVSLNVPDPSNIVLSGVTHTNLVLDGLSTTENLSVGMTVSGVNIAANTTIASITNATTIGLSLATTGSATNLITFGPVEDTLSTDIGGTISINKSTVDLTLATDPTANQLLALQAYYDQIVTGLQSEPLGIVSVDTTFSTSNSTQSSTVDLKFTIPKGITVNHFYQVYRTALATATGVSTLSDFDPGDEEGLVYEANPSATDLQNGYITLTDIVPESFRGANLYTNPNTGEGISQANEIPPFAYDITTFKGYTFYANTKTKQRKLLSLLSISEMRDSGTIESIDINGVVTSTAHGLVDGNIIVISNTNSIPSIDGQYEVVVIDVDTFTLLYPMTTPFNGNINLTTPSTSGTWSKDIASSLTVTDGTTSNIYTFATPSPTAISITTTADVANSLNGKYFLLDATNGTTKYYFWYKTSGGAVSDPAIPGRTGIRIDIATGATHSTVNTTTKNSINKLTDFQVYADFSNDDILVSTSTAGPGGTGSQGTTSFTVATSGGTGESSVDKIIALSTLSTPSQQVDETSRSLVRVINKQTSELVYVFYLSGPDDVPGQLSLESRLLGSNAFYFTVNTTAMGSQFTPVLPTSGNSVISDNEISPNRIYYSKYQQPDAVPLLNYQDVGAKDKKIVRVLALRDNLFVLKEEGVYRLSGVSAPFTVSLFDSSTNIKASDSAVVLNNLIYLFSDQGVATVSDTGVSIISRPIEDLLIKLTIPSYTNFSTATFGVSYETDRSYYLFTVSNVADVYATQCFRYNTFTNTWSILDLSKRCGLVNSFDDKMYLGPIDTNFIEQERKSFVREDHADREIAITIGNGLLNGNILTVSSLTNISAGDVLVQTQYLTINQFNRTLIKLDNDYRLGDNNYYSTLACSPGDALNTKLDLLITKVANDTGRLSHAGFTAAATYTALEPTSSGFVSMQTTFNSFIALLNADPGVGDGNYNTSISSVDYEVIITSTDISMNSVTMQYTYPLINGPATIYNHIPCDVIYTPQYMQDVSLNKHVSEGTLIFESNTFSTATISYSSDLSPGYESIIFPGVGNGSFGNFVYGNTNYGGSGSGIPLRTYIPRKKQRCRYINCRFQHAVAREKFSLYGLSLTYENISTRAYR